MAAKKATIHRRRFLKIYPIKFCDIWQNFYFYRILNDENFKMEVKQTDFVTHLIITVYFLLAKFQLVSSNLSVAIIWQMTYTQKLPKLCSATLS